jgi:hypothetical protein
MSAKDVSCSNINGYLRNYQDCLTLGKSRFLKSEPESESKSDEMAGFYLCWFYNRCDKFCDNLCQKAVMPQLKEIIRSQRLFFCWSVKDNLYFFGKRK